jgi:hypothetical protein
MIVERFNELGLETNIFDGSPYQEFTIPGPTGVGDPNKNSLVVRDGDQEITLTVGNDYNPLALGSNGEFSGRLVFVGYGITAKDLEYDDYADIDVKDKVVVMLRKEPRQDDEQSPFEGTENSQYAYFSTKEVNAALHEVAAVIMVNDSQTIKDAGDDVIPDVSGAGRALSDSQVPTVFAKRAVVEPWIEQATGKSLSELEQAIDSDLKPRSQPLGEFTASGEVDTGATKLPARNVVGLLPGSGSLQDEYVVVGAHYDHVGMGGRGSLAPGTIAIHNGADDNASGTTMVLEVARRMAEKESEDRRNVVFMLFAAEEKGLLGSKHYVRYPRWPLEDTVAMINFDMVGRLSDNRLTVFGTGTAEGFDRLLDRHNGQSRISLDKRTAGFGPSDHSSFYEHDIPVYHFFTGLHNNYHRPSDVFETVNLDGMVRIADLVTGVVDELAHMPERPQQRQVEGYADVGRENARSRGRAILGIQLDLESERPKVDQVEKDGPADQAGLESGDVILKIGDQETGTIEELRGALGSKRPGDTIQLEIEREGESQQLDLKLGRG